MAFCNNFRAFENDFIFQPTLQLQETMKYLGRSVDC